MPGYKLFYFSGRGGGEICRLAFKAAKIDFEDNRLGGLDSDAWAKEKASGRPPFGQMPFIETPEGGVLAMSGTIAKYICKKGGLSPTDSFDEAVADMIKEGAGDLRTALFKVFLEKDEAKKEELRKEFIDTTLPARLEKFSALLKSRNEGKGFFLGDKLTYADISFFDFFNNFLAKGEETVPKELNNYPLLVDHYNRVLNVPEINAWVKKRPKTEF